MFCGSRELRKQLEAVSPQLIVSCSAFTILDQMLLISLVPGSAGTVFFMNSWDNVNGGHGYLRFGFDQAWVWSEFTAQMAIRNQGFKPEDVKVVGFPLLERYEVLTIESSAEELVYRREQLDLPEGKKVVMFFCNSPVPPIFSDVPLFVEYHDFLGFQGAPEFFTCVIPGIPHFATFHECVVWLFF